MLVLSGATLVLPDRLLAAGTLAIDDGRIVDIRAAPTSGTDASALPLHGHIIVPGFIDVHMHGLHGVDTLDGRGAVRRMAALLPRYGVTAFCPTTVACAPFALRAFLADVREARAEPDAVSARVLPAHLESNFINGDYAGAQPSACLRSPRAALDALRRDGARAARPPRADRHAFDGDEVLREIADAAPDVGVVTLAPEVDGAMELIPWLVAGGHRVSLGHSGATYDETMAAAAAGARQATHLFNRMPPLNHRSPGLAGAVLQSPDLAAELICDGVHVHPAMIRTAVLAKGAARVMAISDSTAATGLPVGARARLGDQPIVAGARSALLDDGTFAGSTATMDRIFRVLVETVGLSPVDAAIVCATTPARELGLTGYGVLAEGAVADLVVLDGNLSVAQTYRAGQRIYPLERHAAVHGMTPTAV